MNRGSAAGAPAACHRGRARTSEYHYLWLDGKFEKVREGGRAQQMAIMVAIAVNERGVREVLRLDVGAGETGAAWTAFLRSLVPRGMTGVRLVTSDAHAGLPEAIGSTVRGADWQRCRTHFSRGRTTVDIR